jgi:hypothetical protein
MQCVNELRPPGISHTKREKKGGGEISGASSRPGGPLDAVQQAVEDYLLLDDPDVLPILMAAVAAHKLDVSPVWLLIVGPPSSAKTELITLLKGLTHVHFLSDLTPNTLASGYVVSAGTAEPSLLDRLKNHVLAVKEFTTVLSKRSDVRGELLAQLREVYDGTLSKAWGTQKEFTWDGRVSFIAGVTDEIDRQHAVMSSLGPRFLFLRMRQPDRKAVARRALENRNLGYSQKAAQKAVKQFFRDLTEELPAAPEHLQQRLIDIADFVTRARSIVHKDEKGDAESAPNPEVPGRFVRQLHGLAAGLAVVHGRALIADQDVDLVERVALDCLPPGRRHIIDVLRAHATAVPFATIRAESRMLSESTIRRELDALQLLGTVNKSEGNWVLQE